MAGNAAGQQDAVSASPCCCSVSVCVDVGLCWADLHCPSWCTPAASWRSRRGSAAAPQAAPRSRSAPGQRRTCGTAGTATRVTQGSTEHPDTAELGNLLPPPPEVNAGKKRGCYKDKQR